MKALNDDEIRRNLKARSTINKNGCWIYGKPDIKHYPPMAYKGRVLRAYQVSYILFRGPLPKDKWLCHTCRTRQCVNPQHLKACEPNSVKRSPCGENCFWSKLNNLQVRNILRYYRKATGSTKDLARKYKVSPQTISRIVKNEGWKHIDHSKMALDHDKINEMLQIIRDKDADIFRMVHGIKPYTENCTMKDVGKRYKVCGERIRQIEQRVIMTLGFKRPMHSTGFVFVSQ